jgi:transglutaminase-like putative cysteine protease
MKVFDPSDVGKRDIVQADISFTITSDGATAGNSSGVELTAYFPSTWYGRQKVYKTVFSEKPSKIFRRGPGLFAVFSLQDVRESFEFIIRSEIEITKYDLKTARSKTNKTFNDNLDLSPFLQESDLLPINHPTIRKIAGQMLCGSEIDTLKRIYDFTLDTLEYKKVDRQEGALVSLELKQGVCRHYAELFVTLCRACKIPAREVVGFTTYSETCTTGHAWVDAYIKGYGWVPFEPTAGDARAASFEEIQPELIHLCVNSDSMFGTYCGSEVKIERVMKINSARSNYLEQKNK